MSHLAELVANAAAAINQASDVAALDNVRVEYLGKKGHLTLQMTTLRDLPPEERPAAGQSLTPRKSRYNRLLTRVKPSWKAQRLTPVWPLKPSISPCRGAVLRTAVCIRSRVPLTVLKVSSASLVLPWRLARKSKMTTITSMR